MINVHLTVITHHRGLQILHLLASQKFNLPQQRRTQVSICYLEMLILTYKINTVLCSKFYLFMFAFDEVERKPNFVS